MMLMNPKLSLGSETDVGSSNLLASGHRPYSGDSHNRRGSDTSEHRMSMYGSNGTDSFDAPPTQVSLRMMTLLELYNLFSTTNNCSM